MKFKTYLMESTTGSLLGKTIDGKKITEKTKTEHWKGNFNCGNKQLTSLVGAPTSVGTSFECDSNQLTSLVGAPTSVGTGFLCYDNQLTSLVGAPTSVGRSFYCNNNQLSSLIGAPTSVVNFYCQNNRLTSLIGAPTSVGSDFDCYKNQLTSLRGIHKEIKQAKNFYCTGNPIKEAVLGLLLIKGLKKVEGLPCDDIINRYLPNNRGMESVSRCQDELEEAGYGEFAEL